MKRLVQLLLMLVLLGAYSQDLNKQAIDSIFVEWDKPDVPGCALGIIKDGELVYARGYGMANMEYDIPNTTNSVFRIASTSKQFTAASIVLLVIDGKLNLDDNLKSLYPDFPDYASKITIRHLLNHTSGIRDYLQLSFLKGMRDDDYYEDDEIMQWLISQSDLNFNPGDEYLYSNSGYWLLGQIVETVSGKNMRDFAEERIFNPLQMTSTHFHNDHTEIVRNRASGYVPDEKEGYKISMTTLDMIGDGGIFTTIEDIKKWDDAFYTSEVFGEAFWKEMTRQAVLNSGKQIEYASGLSIGEYKGLKTIRHGGAFVGFRAELLRFPEERLSIAIFANRGDANPSQRAERVADLLLKDKLTVQNKPKKEEESDQPVEEISLDKFFGNYQIRSGLVLEVSTDQDSLHVVQSWDESAYNLARTRGNTFMRPGNKDLSFTFSELQDGFTQILTVVQFDRETEIKRKKTMDTSGIDLNEFTGDYYSPELDVTYHLRLADGILKLNVKGRKQTMDCSMSNTDQFDSEFGLMRFQRSDNRISGFELDSGRVKNLKFQRE